MPLRRQRMVVAVWLLSLLLLSSRVAGLVSPRLSSTCSFATSSFAPRPQQLGVDLLRGPLPVLAPNQQCRSAGSSALASTPAARANGDDVKSSSAKERFQALQALALSFFIKTKNLLMGNGFTTDTSGSREMFSRKALAGLGLNALLAYGFVSNVSYITCLILSWVSHGKLYGLSPLAPGQRKAFLAIYGGFWVTNNVLRPLRFSLSLVLTPQFNKLIDFVVRKTGFKRPTSTGIVIFLVNFCGTISYLVLGLLLATTLTGTPLL